MSVGPFTCLKWHYSNTVFWHSARRRSQTGLAVSGQFSEVCQIVPNTAETFEDYKNRIFRVAPRCSCWYYCRYEIVFSNVLNICVFQELNYKNLYYLKFSEFANLKNEPFLLLKTRFSSFRQRAIFIQEEYWKIDLIILTVTLEICFRFITAAALLLVFIRKTHIGCNPIPVLDFCRVSFLCGTQLCRPQHLAFLLLSLLSHTTMSVKRTKKKFIML